MTHGFSILGIMEGICGVRMFALEMRRTHHPRNFRSEVKRLTWFCTEKFDANYVNS